ncbi:hypothetical protein GCM10009599_27130 [Luteococcus peritonei]
MSETTDAAKIGAQAAQAKAEQTTQVVDAATAEAPAESSWQRGLKKISAGATGLGAAVSDKVSDLRRPDADPGTTGVSGGEMAASGATSAAAGTTSSAGAAGRPSINRRTRKARLRLSRLDPWSVMKTVFLFSIAGAIIFFVATWVIWGVINASGVFDSVNKAVNDLVASPTSESTFRLESYVNTPRILGFAALISAINVVLITALATLFSFLYNLAATVMGGLEVTLAED